jgi:hypothetical protein
MPQARGGADALCTSGKNRGQAQRARITTATRGDDEAALNEAQRKAPGRKYFRAILFESIPCSLRVSLGQQTTGRDARTTGIVPAFHTKAGLLMSWQSNELYNV